MSSANHLRPAVTAARQRLWEGRQSLKEQHGGGRSAAHVCSRLADLLDALVLDLFQDAVSDGSADGEGGWEETIALAAHGGYGRRDVAPYSDVDLMLLHEPGAGGRIAPLVRRLTMNLYDAGLDPGFSVRTPSEACALATRDPTIFTSLVETRRLWGSEAVFSQFVGQFQRLAGRRSRSLIGAVERARREEQKQYGTTVYLLNPNVKRSPGALRDIQLTRWIGFARYGESEPERLAFSGAMAPEDCLKLNEAREHLLRLRNELHFHAGRSHDVLDRDEQVRIAARWGYPGAAGLMPVEQFMREYFDHTSQVRDVAAHFAARAKVRPGAAAAFGSLLSHQFEGDFRVGPASISLTRRGWRKLRGDLEQVLRFVELANLCDKPIDHGAWEAIRRDLAARPDLEAGPEAVQRFLSLLSQGRRLASLLRRLHEVRILEILVAGMSHARCLLQFNDYHKYTVDEHSIRAVQHAIDLLDAPGPVGDAYRGIRRKRTLHLALLIHDLGKGYPEDHCEAGARLADETASRLNLPADEAELLRRLVRKHLLMPHLAFRHDLHDESLIVGLAAEAGSPDALQMLYVHAWADLSAVGPGVMNRWKEELLTELYLRTRSYLTDDAALESARRRLSERRGQLLSQVADRPDVEWWRRQIAALPPGYLSGESSEHVLEELERVRALPRRRAAAWGRFLPRRNVVQFTVGAHEAIVPGVFHRLTGALSRQGQQILSAEIYTLAEQLVLDRFYTCDIDYAGPPPPERLDQIGRSLVATLERPTEKPPVFPRRWRSRCDSSPARKHLPAQVRWDNQTSPHLTILTIFAYDRMGLLYAIARTLFELGLSVRMAKIATSLDQVADVFYVAGGDGRKVADADLPEIRRRLLEAIEPHQASASLS